MTTSKFTPGSEKGRTVVRAGAHSNIAAFLKAMLSGPMTMYQISEATGIYYDTVTGLMKVLKAENVVHICDWSRDSMGRRQTAVYSLGGGDDAPKSSPKTTNERSAKYKAKTKAQNESIFQPKTTFVGGSLWA
jgi:predicted ArsR family transcriptional regulator